jgi:hypothetical protein
MTSQALTHPTARGRREFLLRVGAGAISLAAARTSPGAEGKPVRGLFPIGHAG